MAPVDPLLALSKAPTVIAPPKEELTDLTDDEALEEWASSGTKVMPKSQMTPTPQPQSQAQPQPQPVAATVASAPLPSYFPVAYSTAPRIQEKTSAAIWVVPLALFVLAGGVVAAAAGWYVYHTSDTAANAATVDTSSNVVVPPVATEAPPPAVTLTATTTTPTVASAAPKATATVTTTVTRHGSSTIPSTSTSGSGSGSVRTFAAGNGKPVYVDGKQVGVGGSKITTACGHHMVAVGTGHARGVEIPCNGSTITVGSPDGN